MEIPKCILIPFLPLNRRIVKDEKCCLYQNVDIYYFNQYNWKIRENLKTIENFELNSNSKKINL